MADPIWVPGFKRDLFAGVHGDIISNGLMIAFSNTAPGSETTDPLSGGVNNVLANVTEVSYANAGSRTVTVASAIEDGLGVFRFVVNDPTIPASGGDVGPGQYLYIYNPNSTGKTNALVVYQDIGSAQTITDGFQLRMDTDDTEGLLRWQET